MKNHNNVSIDRDRAFDINALSELLTQGKAILTQAIAISQKMETSIAAIASIYNGIDAEYKVGALGSDIDTLSGRLRKDIYQETISSMDAILNKLINDIPLDLCQYFGQKKLKDYAAFLSSSSSFCWGVI